VLLEKPVAHTVAEATRLIAAADSLLCSPIGTGDSQLGSPVQAADSLLCSPIGTGDSQLGSSARAADPLLCSPIRAAGGRPPPKIGVCLQNRYNVPVRAARQRLLSGELGAVTGASATVLWHRDAAYYRNRPWRGQRTHSGGGVLINQAIHTVDLLSWLLGEVVDVRGHAGRYGSGLEDVIDVEDTANLHFTHAGGATSVLFATVTNAVDEPVTIDIVTEKATLRLCGDLTVTHTDGRIETVAERRAVTGGRDYWGVSHELLIADFYRRLPDPEPFWISPAEGTVALRLIDRIYERTSL
jgi:predicted dehydrogenase